MPQRNAFGNITPICHQSLLLSLPKPGKYIAPILPGIGNLSHHGTVAAPRIPFQVPYILYQSRPEGIQMDVPDELLEIYIFVTYDRFIAILK
jgi:hypothetical protein